MRPPGKRIVENGRSRWGYFQRHIWKYIQRYREQQRLARQPGRAAATSSEHKGYEVLRPAAAARRYFSVTVPLRAKVAQTTPFERALTDAR